ncbi:RING finger protein 112-like isoform X1 [Pleurodeles waltl]|uniref:RING finger protein 112-like isoform X1 n=1 Tax=Pleurodeles waltl TaxID=8319 RepID=UPI0037095679
MMGNSSKKEPTPVQMYTINARLEDLAEDLKCSICLDVFEDPVSIDCSHNFCRGCIEAHWSGISVQGYLCPECRQPCRKDRVIPDFRIKNLVEKIVLGAAEVAMETNEPTDPVAAVQLVGLDGDGRLVVHEQTLKSCLQSEEVKNCLVCMISIIGEQRKGKSFLLNYLLRKLQSLHGSLQETEDISWMGEEEQVLEGFEWRASVHPTTRGIWIWKKPFIINSNGEKIAVFLVDTEGSLDIAGNKELTVKMSALSMLLSSHLIFNVSCSLKEPELEYLEMFAHVAEEVGKTFCLEAIQHLDILVRDCFLPPVYGAPGGEKYMNTVTEQLQGASKHPRALNILKNRSCCFLMPFPGKKIALGSRGTLHDMDDDFRDTLKTYINSLVNKAVSRAKVDNRGFKLTAGKLAEKIKKFVELMKKNEYSFSSPLEMAIALRNFRANDGIKNEYASFIEEQDMNSKSMFTNLKTSPSKMKEKLKVKMAEMMKRSERVLEGDEYRKLDLKMELEAQMRTDMERFMAVYTKRFKISAIKAGVAVGVGTVGLAGGVVGGVVAGLVVAAEVAVVAVGAVAGTGTFAVIGGGLGAGVGNQIGKKQATSLKDDDGCLDYNNILDSDGDGEDPQGFVDLSEEAHLLHLNPSA